jgi:protochlorophyllide reductase
MSRSSLALKECLPTADEQAEGLLYMISFLLGNVFNFEGKSTFEGNLLMSKWTSNDIPDLHGRIAIVTGANSGLGFETTRALAAKGAHVVMACRSLDKGRKALEEIVTSVADASLELVQLDLASLAAVRHFATTFQSSHKHLNILFNNAGVMAIPRTESQDGFEMQFAVNYLAHFALTGLLLPTLLATPQSRIVTLSSVARRSGKVNLDDLNRTKSYSRWEAYGQSKRADLLFAFELQQRLAAAEVNTISVAAHPGFASTNLQTTSASTSKARVESIAYTLFMPIVAQSQAMGALPELYAGTSSDVHGGELVGPASFGGLRGYPHVETKAQHEYDRSLATRLWERSVELTGVDYAELNQKSKLPVE